MDTLHSLSLSVPDSAADVSVLPGPVPDERAESRTGRVPEVAKDCVNASWDVFVINPLRAPKLGPKFS